MCSGTIQFGGESERALRFLAIFVDAVREGAFL
jgi:hypothetical protein